MRQDNFPHPVSDPEAEGLPEYADDESTAYDEVESARVADGPDPAALPADRPLAIDRFGTTAEEARLGESLDYKLAREDPDSRRGPGVAGASGAEPAGQESDDEGDALTDEVDQVHGRAADDLPDVTYDPQSKVSMYDRPDDASDPGRPIGRLVEPDEGSGTDTEPDAVAYDAGSAGGGPSAEEAAMHEVPDTRP
jgi:hypothetical protein